MSTPPSPTSVQALIHTWLKSGSKYCGKASCTGLHCAPPHPTCCERCEHEWVPREGPPPRVCPKCKSPYWDRPRRSDHAIMPVLRSILRTPGVRSIRISGNYLNKRGLVRFDRLYNAKKIIEGGETLEIPLTLTGTVSIHGAYSHGVKPTVKNAVEEINYLRRADGLEPLPADVVCERVDARAFPPDYWITLSALPKVDQSTSPDL